MQKKDETQPLDERGVTETRGSKRALRWVPSDPLVSKTFECELHPGVFVKVSNESIRRLIRVVGKNKILRWKLPVVIMDAEWEFDRETSKWVATAVGQRFSSGKTTAYGFKISPDDYQYIYGVEGPVVLSLDD